MHESLDPRTKVGPVALTVTDLDRSIAYYQHRLGFSIAGRAGDTARLNAGGPDLLTLVERQSATRARGSTGLYHFAVLVPTRVDLAISLQHILDQSTPVQGFADHLVSESIYLADPDGNGIEIYRDRPRSEWPHADGRVRMSTDPLDVDGVLAELPEPAPAWTGLPPGTTIGHMHLHVAHLPDANAFYVNVLGFDVTQQLSSTALFVSAGGYHHHVGLNTWAGVGAPPPPPESVGLRHFFIRLPDAAELDRVVARVERAGIVTTAEDEGVLVRDPSGNGVLLTVDRGLETS